MHNCKLTRNVLTEYALGEIPPAQAKEAMAELNKCASCRAEYAALSNTLRVSRQALQSALPNEEYWPGYHARLQSKLARHLEDAKQTSFEVQPVPSSFSSRLVMGLQKFVTASVRVPVPVALAIMLLAGGFLFTLRPRSQVNLVTPAPVASVETKTVEVPVIKEKIVTQIVYVERKGRRYKNAEGSPGSSRSNTAAVSDPSAKTAMSLAGFKPTNQVNLTIIKGSYQDEK